MTLDGPPGPMLPSPTPSRLMGRGKRRPPRGPGNTRPHNSRPLGASPHQPRPAQLVFDVLLTAGLALVGALYFIAFLLFVSGGQWTHAAIATACWLVAYASIRVVWWS